MKINNKDVIQSYILTASKYDFSVYEKRIMYRLVETFQYLIKGEKLEGKITVNRDLFGDYCLKMPVRSFLKDEKDTNHTLAKEALKSLESKVFEYEDDKTWELIRIIQAPIIIKNSEYVTFRVQPKIFDALLNFTKGYRMYELETAMSFESVYSMRLYELLSGQKKPITYTIDNLKIMFQIEDKYKLNSDFIRFVIDAAKKELDVKSPFSFKYGLNKQGKRTHSITFHPVYIAKNRDADLETKELQKKVSLSWDLDPIVTNYLKENYLFSEPGIKSNVKLFKEASQKLDLLYFLSLKKVEALKKKNPQGWIITVIEKTLRPDKDKVNTPIKRGKQEIKSAKTEVGKTIDLEDMIREVTNKKTV
jgi:plasmid replication initiation protein